MLTESQNALHSQFTFRKVQQRVYSLKFSLFK